MKSLRLIAALSTFVISSAAIAQTAPPVATPPAAGASGTATEVPVDIRSAPVDLDQAEAAMLKAPLNAESLSAEAKSPEAIAAGIAMLEEIAIAYRSAKAMTDTVAWSVKFPGGVQKASITVALGGGQDMQITAGSEQLTSVDGKIYFADSQIADKFVQVPVDGTVIATLKSKFEGMDFPCPHLALRGSAFGKAIDCFSFGGGAYDKVAGYQLKDDAAQIFLAGGDGDLMIVANPKTKLISSMRLVMAPAGAPEGIRFELNYTLNPVVLDALTPPLSFVAGDRKAVASFAELVPTQPQPIAVGDTALGFSLQDFDGKTYTLADLRGKVVVIDFWATWCGPCRKGLPSINALAQWVQETNQPVVVLGINVWERGENPAEKSKQYWTTQGFVFPTLLDLEGNVIKQYGFNSIPATVIIGTDGKVATVHQGFDPKVNLTEVLKADIAKALQTKG